MNSILLVTPHWHRRHSFIARHAECIKKELAGIITNNNPPVPGSYNCPIIALSEPLISICEKVVRRFHGYPKYRNVHRERRFARILKQYAPDIVLFEFATMGVEYADVCIHHNIPFVIHFHGYDVTSAFQNEKYNKLLHRITQNAKCNIANSKSTITRLKELGIQGSNVRLKYLGVRIPVQPSESPSCKILKIVHLGSFFDVKNPLGTIKAFKWATENGLEATMIMAGEGPLKTDCEHYVHNNRINNITFLETVSNKEAIDLIKSSHLLTQHSVLTSSFSQEGFGVVIAEAMSNATPVVVTDHGAFPELVIDGKTGILFPEHDWKAQGRAFLELDNDRGKLRQYGLAGYERVRLNFSLEKECHELRSILGLDK